MPGAHALRSPVWSSNICGVGGSYGKEAQGPIAQPCVRPSRTGRCRRRWRWRWCCTGYALKAHIAPAHPACLLPTVARVAITTTTWTPLTVRNASTAISASVCEALCLACYGSIKRGREQDEAKNRTAHGPRYNVCCACTRQACALAEFKPNLLEPKWLRAKYDALCNVCDSFTFPKFHTEIRNLSVLALNNCSGVKIRLPKRQGRVRS